MGGSSTKRKKHHDKDKYYRLAKEQGFRSRAAFKLSQINRKFQLLEQCQSGLLDLCAAPGGWTQIAARTCPKNIPIIAVDILPIRPLQLPNVTTLIGDITTDKCKSDISRALKGISVDVVLCDGAPNIGAEYGKDAYEQNELALHCVKCATQHLRRGGAFITKLYRSKDYTSFLWVLQQLFEEVSAFKPKASRVQSAEIFVVAQRYKAPAKLDPRFLDPKHVFESVDGGGGDTPVDIFHKQWDKKQRKRNGYDMTRLDAAMRHIESVQNFVTCPSLKEAIQILSESTGLEFTCAECKNSGPSTTCLCRMLKQHPFTTPEIKECLGDLQVLNKVDFKGLLSWRTKMQEALAARHVSAGGEEVDHSGSDSEGSEKEEERIQEEIQDMRQRRLREKKRQKKKEREAAAKRRQRAALGMDLNAIDVPEHDQVFSLATISSAGDLEAVSQVNLDEITDEVFIESDDEVLVDKERRCDAHDGRSNREEDLDAAYEMYLLTTKNGLAKSGTKMAKRSKRLQRMKLAEEAEEDIKLASASTDHDAKAYAKMLQGDEESDEEEDGDNSENDDGFFDELRFPENSKPPAKKQKTGGGLLHEFADEPNSATARWFSNPLFSKIASIGHGGEGIGPTAEDENDDLSGSTVTDEAPNVKNPMGISAEEVLAQIPKTDKQKRHDRRLKQMAREERKQARKANRGDDSEFEVVPTSEDYRTAPDRPPNNKAKLLIEAGFGKMVDSDDNPDHDEIEVVPEASRHLQVMDDRKYDSDNEEYDNDDHARTLALGTMLLRRSKEKAFADASYNRYAWNDPSNLPDWFVDDEQKHYRPQIPIPPVLLNKMKEKLMALSTKPIAKVAEARARKNRRAKAKLAAAKKQAEAVANSSEMSEAMKLKAISKALRGQETRRPSKTYVVAKKGRPVKGAKGMKLVDKRMKADKRGVSRKRRR